MEVVESLKSMNITSRLRPSIEGVIDHPGIQFMEPSEHFKAPIIDLRPDSDSRFEVILPLLNRPDVSLSEHLPLGKKKKKKKKKEKKKKETEIEIEIEIQKKTKQKMSDLTQNMDICYSPIQTLIIL
jgi:hypothetical protein